MRNTELTNALRDMARNETDRVAELITNTITDPITVVSVQEFEKTFLPMLIKAGENFPVQNWIKEVSHPYVRLNVIGSDGTVLYDIPPVLAQQSTVRVPGFRIVDQADTIRSLESDNPRAAIQFVGNMLSNFEDGNFSINESANEMTIALNKVFAAYNVPLLPMSNEVKTQMSQQSSIQQMDDSIEYEPM